MIDNADRPEAKREDSHNVQLGLGRIPDFRSAIYWSYLALIKMRGIYKMIGNEKKLSPMEKVDVDLQEIHEIREELTKILSTDLYNRRIPFLINKMEMFLLSALFNSLESSESMDWLIQEQDQHFGYMSLLAECYFTYKLKLFLSLAEINNPSDYFNQLCREYIPTLDKILEKINGDNKEVQKKSSSLTFFSGNDSIVPFQQLTKQKFYDLMGAIYKSKYKLLMFTYKELFKIHNFINKIMNSFDNFNETLEQLYDSLNSRITLNNQYEEDYINNVDFSLKNLDSLNITNNVAIYSEIANEIKDYLKKTDDDLDEDERNMLFDIAIEYDVGARDSSISKIKMPKFSSDSDSSDDVQLYKKLPK